MELVNMKQIALLTLAATLLANSISTATAYIGPGMGGGVIVAVLGILGAIFIGLFGIIYFPIKRALKNKAKKKNDQASNDDNTNPGDNDQQEKS